jgi:3-oxoacyl-[acyl-carrier protein] reductase
MSDGRSTTRNVVVTGGSRGIGLGICQALAKAGFRVIPVARTFGPYVAEALCLQPDQWHPVAWDLSKIDTLALLAQQLRSVGPIYGLVNNAGIGPAGVLATMPDAQIAEVMQMNAISPMTLTKHVLRSMLAARAGGRIVNIASIVAQTGYVGLAPYSASKAALIGFTRSLAREVGSLGITVNTVSPGFVATEMTHGLTEKHVDQITRRSALQRMVSVADIAATVEFLISDKGMNITGQVLTVDAGNTV